MVPASANNYIDACQVVLTTIYIIRVRAAIVKIIRIGVVVAVAISALSVLAPAARAQNLDSPGILQIQEVEAFRHLLEANDTLYIARYNIDWGNETQPYYLVDQTFIFQFMNDANVTVQSVTAYPFHNSGYGAGLVSWYFPGNSTDPSWGELGNVTIQETALFASPANVSYQLTADDYTSYTSPADIREAMRQFLIAQLLFIDLNWNEYYLAQGGDQREITLLEYLSDSKSYVLSTNGEAYMSGAIPGLDDMLPDLYMFNISVIDYEDKEHSQAAATAYDEQFDDTPVEEFKIAMGDFMGGVGSATAFSLMAVMLVMGNSIFTTMMYNRLFLGLMISVGPVLILTRLGLPDLALIMIAITITIVWAFFGILGRNSQG